MNLSIRINAFCSLGDWLRDLSLAQRKALAEKARNENPWFTEDNVILALKGIETLLHRDSLTAWATHYSPEPSTPKIVGLAAAGNIPAVGFHDFMCVLISGHKLKAKLSSQDSVLLKFLLSRLVEIEPRFAEQVTWEDMVKNVQAMIATGSDNTARYFEYYFRNIPHIIRKNRASCAVVQGEEPPAELELLGRDVFSYFGLGCRNVSKIFVPEEFELSRLFESWQSFASVIHHNKYANNYDYQKTVLLVNSEPFLESEFILLRESKNLVSPIGVLFYEKYQTQDEVREKIRMQEEKLQVIVSARGWYPASVPFGKAQFPEPGDYADHVDTMQFLKDLK
jgi:hypothetical protein